MQEYQPEPERRTVRLIDLEKAPPEFATWAQGKRLARRGGHCPQCMRCNATGLFGSRQTCAFCGWCETD